MLNAYMRLTSNQFYIMVNVLYMLVLCLVPSFHYVHLRSYHWPFQRWRQLVVAWFPCCGPFGLNYIYWQNDLLVHPGCKRSRMQAIWPCVSRLSAPVAQCRVHHASPIVRLSALTKNRDPSRHGSMVFQELPS